MSMIGNLARLSAATCERLHQQPELISSFIYPERTSDLPKPKPSFFGRLFGKEAAAPPTSPLPKPSETMSGDDAMDLDKAWHGLHFLFTGSDWEGAFPQGFLVTCGDPVGDIDVGYGPARSFSPEQVQQIAVFLNTQSESELRRRFDPKKMADLEIYPSIWSSDTNLNDE